VKGQRENTFLIGRFHRFYPNYPRYFYWMILYLSHKNLEVYEISRKLVQECYILTRAFPAIEKFNLVQQINRAALSVVLNIAEGASRKSSLERKRFYEISRGSIIEIDAALQISFDLNYIDETNLKNIKPLVQSTFNILSRMIKTLSS
jgi:four helix bundle protein